MGWWHIGCVGITNEKYKFLKDDQISWYCSNCKYAAKGLKNQMVQMKKTMDEMKFRLDTLETNQVTKEEVRQIVQRNVETAVKEQLDETLKELPRQKQEEAGAGIRDTVVEIMSEVKENEKRMDNFIIHKLNENEEHEEEMEEIESIIKHIDNKLSRENIKTYKRIGTKEEGKNRPVLVNMQTPEQVWSIISNAKKLKGSKWNISIEADRTKKCREHIKELRTKARAEKGDEADNFLYRTTGRPGLEKVVAIPKRKDPPANQPYKIK